MAYSNLKTDYTDAVYSGLKKYMMITNDDGTVSFQDVTNYTNKEKSFFSANDANQMNTTLNNIMAGNTDVALRNETVEKLGGDISNTIISAFETQTAGYPIPAAGDSTKGALGKIVKFFNDTKTLLGKVVLKGHIVNNTTSTRTDMPLAANQGKVLSGRINLMETFLSGKTYRQFTAKPADWLGSGMISVAAVDINNHFSYAPPTKAGNVAFYNVMTIGTSTRCTQIALYGFSGASVDRGSIFFRRQHDNDVSGWMKWL